MGNHFSVVYVDLCENEDVMKIGYLLGFTLSLLAGSLRVYYLGFLIYNISDTSLIRNRKCKEQYNVKCKKNNTPLNYHYYYELIFIFVLDEHYF